MGKKRPCKPKPKEPVLISPSIFGAYLIAKMKAQMVACENLELYGRPNPAQIICPVHIK